MSKKMCMTDDGRWFPFVPEKKVSNPVAQEVSKPSAIDSDVSNESAEVGSDVEVSNVDVEVSDKMTVKELKLIAKARGIKFDKKATKDALLELLIPVDL